MRKYTLVILPLLALAACQNVKKELGVGRNSPDEFAVVKRAPLSMPPDYNLRPPGTEYASPGANASAEARSVLLGTAESAAPVAANGADKTFMDKLGTARARPDIRSKINEENGYIALQSQTVADKLIFWDKKDPDIARTPASVVNAAKETERLKANQADGKPVNEGDVPVIEKKRNTLDKLF